MDLIDLVVNLSAVKWFILPVIYGFLVIFVYRLTRPKDNNSDTGLFKESVIVSFILLFILNAVFYAKSEKRPDWKCLKATDSVACFYAGSGTKNKHISKKRIDDAALELDKIYREGVGNE